MWRLPYLLLSAVLLFVAGCPSDVPEVAAEPTPTPGSLFVTRRHIPTSTPAPAYTPSPSPTTISEVASSEKPKPVATRQTFAVGERTLLTRFASLVRDTKTREGFASLRERLGTVSSGQWDAATVKECLDNGEQMPTSPSPTMQASAHYLIGACDANEIFTFQEGLGWEKYHAFCEQKIEMANAQFGG